MNQIDDFELLHADELAAMNDFEQQYADDLDALNDLEKSSCVKNDVNEEVIGEVLLNLPDTTKRPSTGDELDIPRRISPHKRQCTFDDEGSSVSPECNSVKKFKFTHDSQDGTACNQLLENEKCESKQSNGIEMKSLRFAGIPITKYDGTKAFMKIKEDDVSNGKQNLRYSSGLLSVPINILKEEVFIKKDRNQNFQYVPSSQKTVLSGSQLWVEKYRPQAFVELLSDEGVNRILLSWLKLWDKVVFGRDLKQKDKKSVSQSQQKQISKFRKPVVEVNDTLDEHGRPQQKVALLFGPPGLGKTTLAHVIARHAGYNVVELNASDDRSPDIFRCSLEAATQMKAVMGKDKRPNCLVIDEIDGAPAASINVLLSFIQSSGFSKGKKKKGDIPILKRPIICICNDQYVPALKTLRQIALSVNFPSTLHSRLASRLSELAVKEGLKAEMTLLLLLCDKAENDIRSCLSTLQFLCDFKKELKASDLSGTNIGQKDMHQSLFSIWQDIFFMAKSNEKHAIGSGPAKLSSDNITKSSSTKVLKAVQAFGDFEKLFIGLFQNYLNAKSNKLCMDVLCQGSDWLCCADILQAEIWTNQHFLLIPYLSYVPLAFHLLFCSSGVHQLSYPSAYYECVLKRSQLTNVVSSVVNEVITSLKSFCNMSCLVTDLLPAVAEIIKPTLRPVSTHLYSDREKKELRKVIDVMISFSLNYRQERAINGEYTYVLEPNIEELVSFKDVKMKKTLSYAAKQLIAQEVAVEKMRRSDVEDSNKDGEPSNKSLLFNKNSKQQHHKLVVEKPTLDFFGRKIDVPEQSLEDSFKEDKNDIWFHFKEGYSNAVRRTVYVKDFL